MTERERPNARLLNDSRMEECAIHYRFISSSTSTEPSAMFSFINDKKSHVLMENVEDIYINRLMERVVSSGSSKTASDRPTSGKG